MKCVGVVEGPTRFSAIKIQEKMLEEISPSGAQRREIILSDLSKISSRIKRKAFNNCCKQANDVTD